MNSSTNFSNNPSSDPFMSLLKYLTLGILFGIVFVKAEIISWYRIQEMFRMQSFHMYGVIGSAVVVGIISIQIIKRLKIKTLQGENIEILPKKFHKGQIYGSLIFGLGWAITGACPGPLFAQIGSGFTVIIVTLISAIAGTWLFGRFEKYLGSAVKLLSNLKSRNEGGTSRLG